MNKIVSIVMLYLCCLPNIIDASVAKKVVKDVGKTAINYVAKNSGNNLGGWILGKKPKETSSKVDKYPQGLYSYVDNALLQTELRVSKDDFQRFLALKSDKNGLRFDSDGNAITLQEKFKKLLATNKASKKLFEMGVVFLDSEKSNHDNEIIINYIESLLYIANGYRLDKSSGKLYSDIRYQRFLTEEHLDAYSKNFKSYPAHWLWHAIRQSNDRLAELVIVHSDESIIDKKYKEPINLIARLGNEIDATIKDEINPIELDEYDFLNHVTALHLAVKYNRLQVAELLLERSAKTDALDDKNNTPLHYAVDNPKMIQLLSDYGSDVEAENSYGQRPLHCAVIAQSGKGITKLLENKADVNAINKSGDHPLSIAIDQAYVEGTDLLVVQEGIDLEHINDHGLNFLENAYMKYKKTEASLYQEESLKLDELKMDKLSNRHQILCTLLSYSKVILHEESLQLGNKISIDRQQAEKIPAFKDFLQKHAKREESIDHEKARNFILDRSF